MQMLRPSNALWKRATLLLRGHTEIESVSSALLTRLLSGTAVDHPLQTNGESMADQSQLGPSSAPLPMSMGKLPLDKTSVPSSVVASVSEGVRKPLPGPQKLAAALEKNRVQLAWDLFREMRLWPQNLTQEACNFMLNSCAIYRRPDLALEIFEFMEAKIATADMMSHSCLLRALSRGGRAKAAVQLLEKLVSKANEGGNCNPNIVMFNSVLNGCAYAASQPLADRCLNAMKQMGLDLDCDSYAELIKLGGLAKDIKVVEQWWGEAVSRLGRPCHVAHVARIGALARCGELQSAVDALHEFCRAALDGHMSLSEKRYRGLLKRAEWNLQRSKYHDRQTSELRLWKKTTDMGAVAPNKFEKKLWEGDSQISPGAVHVGPQLFPFLSTNEGSSESQTQPGGGEATSGERTDADIQLADVGVRTAEGASPLEYTEDARGELQDRQTVADRSEGADLEQCQGWWSGRDVSLLEKWLQKELVIAYNVVLNIAGKTGNYELVSTLISEMNQAALELDSYSYNAWMRASARSSGLQTTLAVWKDMQARGTAPSRHSHEALLDALCRENRLDEAEALLEDMRMKGHSRRLLPSKYAYNGILEACAAQGDLDRAMRIYGQMREAQVQPDTCTFLALLSGCGGPRAAGVEGGRWAKQDAIARLDAIEKEMEEAGVKHNAATFTATVILLGREGMVREVRKRLAATQGKLDPYGRPLLDTITCNAAIQACVQSGKVDQGLELLKEMAERNISPDLATFNSLINGCSYGRHGGAKMALAFELADTLRQHGFAPDLYTYNSLIKVVCHGGMLEVGLQLMEQMETSGVFPDHFSVHTVMESANHHKRLDAVEFLLEHMHRLGLRPDSTTCCHAVTAYVAAERPEDAVEALRVLSARMLTMPKNHPSAQCAANVAINTKASKPSEPQVGPQAFARAHNIGQGMVKRLSAGQQGSFSRNLDQDKDETSSGEGQPETGSSEWKVQNRRRSNLFTIEQLLLQGSDANDKVERVQLPSKDLLESGVLSGNDEALASFMLKLAASVDGRELDHTVEYSPWAARLRLIYNSRHKVGALATK